jgi:hypothetical protein
MDIRFLSSVEAGIGDAGRRRGSRKMPDELT